MVLFGNLSNGGTVTVSVEGDDIHLSVEDELEPA